jgi:hypothetical protein
MPPNTTFTYYESAFNDSTTTSNIKFNGTQSFLNFIYPIPKNSTILNATFEIKGSPDLTPLIYKTYGTYTGTTYPLFIGDINNDGILEIIYGFSSAYSEEYGFYLVNSSNGNVICSQFPHSYYNVTVRADYNPNVGIVVLRGDRTNEYVDILDTSCNILKDIKIGPYGYHFIKIANITPDSYWEILAMTYYNLTLINASNYQILWSYNPPYKMYDVKIADIDGNPNNGLEIALLSLNAGGSYAGVTLFNSTGSILWSYYYYPYQYLLNEGGLDVGDILPDPGMEIVYGEGYTGVVLLNSSGQLKWKNTLHTPNYGIRVKIANITPDSYWEILADNDGVITLIRQDNIVVWDISGYYPGGTGPIYRNPIVADIDGNPNNGLEIWVRSGSYQGLLNSSGNIIWFDDVGGLSGVSVDSYDSVMFANLTGGKYLDIVLPVYNSLFTVAIIPSLNLPSNVLIDVGNDGTIDYSSSTSPFVNISLPSVFQNYINSATTDPVLVPINVTSTNGVIQLSKINITYTYNISDKISKGSDFLSQDKTAFGKADYLENDKTYYKIFNISFLSNPINNITVKYIEIQPGATEASFNGTPCSIAIVNGITVCNLTATKQEFTLTPTSILPKPIPLADGRTTSFTKTDFSTSCEKDLCTYRATINIPDSLISSYVLKIRELLSNLLNWAVKVPNSEYVYVDNYETGPAGGKVTWEVSGSDLIVTIPNNFYSSSLPVGTHTLQVVYTASTPAPAGGGEIVSSPAQLKFEPETINLTISPGDKQKISVKLCNVGQRSVYPVLESLSEWVSLTLTNPGTINPGECVDVYGIEVQAPWSGCPCNLQVKASFEEATAILNINVAYPTTTTVQTPDMMAIATNKLNEAYSKIQELMQKNVDVSLSLQYYNKALKECQAQDWQNCYNDAQKAIDALPKPSPPPSIIDIISNIINEIINGIKKFFSLFFSAFHI